MERFVQKNFNFLKLNRNETEYINRKKLQNIEHIPFRLLVVKLTS